jgi:hypothetical protein
MPRRCRARRRLQLRKDLALTRAGAEGSSEEADAEGAVAGEGGSEEPDEETRVIEQMEGLRERAAHDLKKQRKKRREAKKKARIRAAQLSLSACPPRPSACYNT